MRRPGQATPVAVNSQLARRYDWQRLWICGYRRLACSTCPTPASYVIPSTAISARLSFDRDRQLRRLPGARLVGRAGHRQSSELKQEHDWIAAVGDPLRQSMYGELRVGSSEESFRQRIFEAATFVGWRTGGGTAGRPDRSALHPDRVPNRRLAWRHARVRVRRNLGRSRCRRRRFPLCHARDIV
jgi:hypothetical protein